MAFSGGEISCSFALPSYEFSSLLTLCLLLQMLPGLLLWKDNQYLFKLDISLKEMKLGTIEIEYEKKLSAVAGVLELSETELAKAKSEKESADRKVEDAHSSPVNWQN